MAILLSNFLPNRGAATQTNALVTCQIPSHVETLKAHIIRNWLFYSCVCIFQQCSSSTTDTHTQTYTHRFTTTAKLKFSQKIVQMFHKQFLHRENIIAASQPRKHNKENTEYTTHTQFPRKKL